MHQQNRIFKRLFRFFAWFFLITGILFLLFLWRIQIPHPQVKGTLVPAQLKREQTGENSFRIGNNWLRKNKQGIWEMYIEGNDYERGVIYGVLAKELMEKQEDYFVDQINEIIPGKFYLQFLKMFVAWFNKDIYDYIPEENLREIFGVSLSFSDKYDYIGPKYYRILNYHAAHDIGHALNDYQLVGCTSFAVNHSYSQDSSLLIGRNFDFYMGDDFSKEKLLLFVKPDSGYGFASYAWAGLTGVVSGMNTEGLSVTINAAKSDIPFAAKDPISLLVREILQYAKNVEEAVAIASKRQTFVSETIMVGSANDHKAVLIEKSPAKLGVFDAQNDVLICSNHYQGKEFEDDKENVKNIEKSDSKSRSDRMMELIQANKPLSFFTAADVLRNKQGLQGKDIGYGNPKSINQLISHHSILFEPEKGNMWVSTMPYQEGEYVYYNLTEVFANRNWEEVDSLNIPGSDFVNSESLMKFEAYKQLKQKLYRHNTFGVPLTLSEEEIEKYIQNNPMNFNTYVSLGDYFYALKNYERAIHYYEQSLNQEVSSKAEEEKIITAIAKSKNKLQK